MIKRILIITGIFSSDIGGPASYGAEIAGRLVKRFEVSVITYSPTWSYSGDKDVAYSVRRIWKKWPWFMRHLLYVVAVLARGRKADLIFALNAINAGPSAVVAAKLYKKKFFVKIAGDRAWETAIQQGKTNLLITDFQKSPRRGWIGILHRFQVWTCKRAAGVIVPSEFLADLVAGWGIDRDKIHVVYNGVDFAPSPLSKEEARREISISGNLLISVGRMVPWKGFRMLVKIMPQLLRVNQFFRLVIVGDGPEMKILQSMVKNLGLDRKVYLVGKKTHAELATYFAASDLFVLNTGYEGFSHQILEALSVGVPVITTAVGGNREVIRQGENGFMVKYNDEFNLIEAIKTLWDMADLREKFIEEGRRTIQEFSLDRMIKETIRLLNSQLLIPNH